MHRRIISGVSPGKGEGIWHEEVFVLFPRLGIQLPQAKKTPLGDVCWLLSVCAGYYQCVLVISSYYQCVLVVIGECSSPGGCVALAGAVPPGASTPHRRGPRDVTAGSARGGESPSSAKHLKIQLSQCSLTH